MLIGGGTLHHALSLFFLYMYITHLTISRSMLNRAKLGKGKGKVELGFVNTCTVLYTKHNSRST